MDTSDHSTHFPFVSVHLRGARTQRSRWCFWMFLFAESDLHLWIWRRTVNTQWLSKVFPSPCSNLDYMCIIPCMVLYPHFLHAKYVFTYFFLPRLNYLNMSKLKSTSKQSQITKKKNGAMPKLFSSRPGRKECRCNYAVLPITGSLTWCTEGNKWHTEWYLYRLSHP